MTESKSFLITRTGARQHRIAVIDGPNMSYLGRRNKRMYGEIDSLDSLKQYVAHFGNQLGVETESFSSNFEGAILVRSRSSGARRRICHQSRWLDNDRASRSPDPPGDRQAGCRGALLQHFSKCVVRTRTVGGSGRIPVHTDCHRPLHGLSTI